MELKVHLEKQKKQSKLLLPDNPVELVVEEVGVVEKKEAKKKKLTGGPDYRRVTFHGMSGSFGCM